MKLCARALISSAESVVQPDAEVDDGGFAAAHDRVSGLDDPAVSKSTLPRVKNGHRYCWAEHPGKHVHCTEPTGHSGRHWHPYTRTSW